MNALDDIALGGALLGSCAWASNVWPGTKTWLRAALSRLVWWAVPFAAIALSQGVTWDHALYLGTAAWLGAWIPHTEMPDVRTHWTTLLSDLAVAVLRAAALLSVPSAVFWACGAFWIAMTWAVFAVVPAVLAASKLPHRWPGLCSERQMSGVLFGIAVGMCVAAAIAIEVPMPDRLP